MAVSWAVFGTGTWLAFLRAAPIARSALEAHQEDWGKLQSLFTTVRLAGAPLWAGYAGQFTLAIGVLAVLAFLTARRPGGDAEAALLAAAAVLCTPHVLDYDLAVIGAPLAWLARRAQATAWLPWEKLLAGSAFLWPLFARGATDAGWPLAPLLLLGLFAGVCRRAYRPRGTSTA
jgi:hypothetical protein